MDKIFKNILIIGDSLSRGVILDEAKKKYVFLQKSFVNIVNEFITPALHNCAKFGATILHGKNNLEKNLEKYSPDIVLIEYGGNDCNFLWDEIAASPLSLHEPNTSLELFEESLTQMVTCVVKSNATPVLMTLPPLNAKSFFSWFTQGGKEKGDEILKWLDDVWRIYWWQERYSSVIASVAQKLNVACIDVRHAFLSGFDFDDDFRNYICSDGIHPNEKGHQIIADTIMNFINKNASFLLKTV